MSLLAGILRKEDETPLITIPVRELSDAVNALNEKYVNERNTWDNFLVEQETIEHKVNHLLGGTDEGQEIGEDGRPLETRVAGKIDVGFPWRRYGWAVGWNYETFARMTLANLERNLADKQGGNAKRHIREQFKALFNNVNDTSYVDEDWGATTIRRLANTDGTTYPTPYNSDTAGDDNHYLTSGYAANALSATNNPFATLKADIIEHFGSATRVVAIINTAQRAEVMTDMPNFIDAVVSGVTPGADTAIANDLGVSIPGTFLGVEADSGVWVYVNDEGRVPANYIVAGAVGAPAPLWRRVPRTPVLQGFKLEAEEETYPMFKRTYVDRFGYGVANRLSAAVMFLDAGSTYVIPTQYT